MRCKHVKRGINLIHSKLKHMSNLSVCIYNLLKSYTEQICDEILF